MLMAMRTDNYDKFLGKRIGDMIKIHRVNPNMMSTMIDISRNTINRIIKNYREVQDDELEVFAEFFRVSIERLTMRDISSKCKEAEKLIANLSDKKRLLVLTQELASVDACDYSEKAYLMRLRGISLDLCGYHTEAQRAFNNALVQAEKCNNEDMLKMAIQSVVTNMIYLKDFNECVRVINRHKEIFVGDILGHAKIMYSLSHCYHALESRDMAKKTLEESLASYKVAKEQNLIEPKDNNYGKILVSLANMEKQDGEFTKAEEYSAVGMVELEKSPFWYIHACKTASQIMFELDKHYDCLEIINNGLEKISQIDVDISDVHGKLLLMKTLVTGDIQYAVQAGNIEKLSNKVRVHAYHTVATMSHVTGDFQTASTYFMKMMSCSQETISTITQL